MPLYPRLECIFDNHVSNVAFQTPMMNMFRHSKSLLLTLLGVTFIFSMIAISPIGFPYTAKTNVGRVNFLVSICIHNSMCIRLWRPSKNYEYWPLPLQSL